MKSFERITKEQVISYLPPGFDKYQFAYRCKRSVDDAISILNHETLKHLERNKSYVRILFVDFSSAFNTIVPSRLYLKVHKIVIPTYLCDWILDFLTSRTQYVKMGDKFSETISIDIGSPQGWVLSAILFTLYTNDLKVVSKEESGCLIIKFADDTTLVGLIKDGDEEN